MKISDLIRKLEILKESHGDNELDFGVKDYYSRYSKEANFNLVVGDESKFGHTWWDGVYTNDGRTRLELHLKPYDNKHPKITYRK